MTIVLGWLAFGLGVILAALLWYGPPLLVHLIKEWWADRKEGTEYAWQYYGVGQEKIMDMPRNADGTPLTCDSVSSWALIKGSPLKGSPPFEPGPLAVGGKCKCGRYVFKRVITSYGMQDCWQDTNIPVADFTYDGSINRPDCGEYLKNESAEAADHGPADILRCWSADREQGIAPIPATN